MTSEWSLAALFADFHEKIQSELATARKLGHPTDKGDASEQVWIDVLTHYLPRRYEARKGFVVDSRGVFSQQIDVIIHDRQYSPFVFTFKGTDVVPAESVYAVFEAKQVSTVRIAHAPLHSVSTMRPNAPIMMSTIKISAITIARGDITTVIVDIAMVVTTDIIGHVPPPSKPLGYPGSNGLTTVRDGSG